jgi:cGMP-dependent protein kinase
VAHPDCIVLEASWDSIIKNLQQVGASNKTLNIFKRINKLKKICIFKHLSEPKLFSLTKLMKKEDFNTGDYIVKENTVGNKFYLINKGRVKISKDKKFIRDMEAGNCFGEMSLIRSENRSASVVADGAVQCYSITKEDFMSIIDKNMQEYIRRKISLQDTSITLGSLYNIKFLGKGKFGRVNLVHNSQNIYAMKAVSRKMAEKRKVLAKYFVLERRIMLTIDHPFIIKLVKTMRNNGFCFFLMEFINGKNLDEVLSARKAFRNKDETRFYIGSLLLVLEYLHKKNIAHRDLKPSNMMIDQNGYLKLLDFGTSKIVTDFTYTIIGTPHYIAPEILQGKGYSLSSDIWSLGICAYEIFFGSYPFGNSALDILDVYKEILYRDFAFPSDPNHKSSEIKNFIRMVLCKKVNQRNCSFSKLKQSDLFKDFEWDDLIDLKLKSPHIPDTHDWYKHIGNKSQLYEAQISQEFEKDIKDDPGDDDGIVDYDKRWADEF